MRKDKMTGIYRDAIMSAAEYLFEQKGYEATSSDDIARRAGISKSKYMELLLEEAEKAADGDAPFEDRYYKLCFDIADDFERHPLFCKATLGKISVDTDQELYKRIYEVGEETNEAIAKFIRSGIEEGAVRKDIDVYPAVIMMWSSISGIISTAYDKEEYLQKRYKMTKDKYLWKAFKMLLEGAK